VTGDVVVAIIGHSPGNGTKIYGERQARHDKKHQGKPTHSCNPTTSNFEAAAASFAESENAETLTKANFSPMAARSRGDDQLIGRESKA
jgi:hypothetical protein